VLWLKIGHMRPTCHAGWPWNLSERPHLVAPPPFPHWILLLLTYFDTWWKCFMEIHRTWPVGPTLGQFYPSIVPCRPFVSYCSWTPMILDIIKICMDFGPYGVFLSSNVPVMVDQQNSWNSLVISTYLLYLEWNIGMHFMTANSHMAYGLTTHACEAAWSEVLNADQVMHPSQSASNYVSGL
jgi:hypothetical protein